MTDRVPGAPGQHKAVITNEELQKLQAGKEFTVTLRRDDQPVEEGTPYSKAAVLPDEVAAQLCPKVEDPTPADAFKALAKGLHKNLGSAKETFNMLDGKFFADTFQNCYFTKDYERVDKEGCYSYEATINTSGGRNTDLLGNTLKIKTYAYGDMACVLYGVYGVTLTGSVYNGFAVNPTADVTANPESGVCEFEITVPNEVWGDLHCAIHIPFCENPYTELEIYEKKGTAWEEIKNLRQATPIASGVVDDANGNKWYYRKFGDGFAECWSNVTATFSGLTAGAPVAGEMAYAYIPLPFPYTTSKWEPVVQCEFDRGQRETAPDMIQPMVSYDGVMVNVYVTWVESSSNDVRCRLYVAGVCF